MKFSNIAFTAIAYLVASEASAQATERFDGFVKEYCSSEDTLAVRRFQLERTIFPLKYSNVSVAENGVEHSAKGMASKQQVQNQDFSICDCGCGSPEATKITGDSSTALAQLTFACGCARTLQFKNIKGKWFLKKIEISED
jgi:hypothetical protein